MLYVSDSIYLNPRRRRQKAVELPRLINHDLDPDIKDRLEEAVRVLLRRADELTLSGYEGCHTGAGNMPLENPMSCLDCPEGSLKFQPLPEESRAEKMLSYLRRERLM